MGGRLFSFVRRSHIFAASVREILEMKLLREVSPSPLTFSQLQLLKLMASDGHHHVGEMADFLGVSPPAATKNVDKLERLGLVVRRPSTGDRRATLLSVSSEGRRLVEDYEAAKRTRLDRVLDSFESAEIDQFSALLERFSVSLLSHEPSGRGYCLRCAAYIESNCPVGHLHGGCPFSRLDETRRGGLDAGES
ncbi:MAG: MarR family transcriptional regulator [bacterium]|nr:MarR family transcriptional regulator [bacterium]